VESLGWKQLNRAILARQLLMERSRLPLHRVVERMAGAQAQYIPSAYVGLWSRTEGFTRDTLTGALQRGSVIQGTLMRGTIHLVSRADYWPIAAAIRDLMREWWLRVDRSGRSAEEMEELAGRLRIVLADGPKRRAELVDELDIGSSAWSGVGYWVELVRVPPSGTWDSRRADLYALAEHWVGPDDADPVSGTDLFIRRYLSGFGPASRDDIRSFTRLDLATIDEALARLSVRTLSDVEGQRLFDLRQAPIPDRDTPVPLRFLGTWDASLLVHARRWRVLRGVPRSDLPHQGATLVQHLLGRRSGSGDLEGGKREDTSREVPTYSSSLPSRAE
jgi:hypothetical protein